MKGQLFLRTKEGVPQGGIISPLLANIYLHELDKWADNKWHDFTPYERSKIRKAGEGSFMFVRYADDFVVMSNAPMPLVKQAKEQIKAFLADELKLTLSDEKTKITHVNEGFDFLGFNIRRTKYGNRYVTHLRPAEKSIGRIKDKIKCLTDRKHLLQSEVDKMVNLNQIVRGWCNYYRHTSLHRDLENITMYTWHRYHAWLLKKFKGSRKRQLIQDKTTTLHGRTRWYAEYKMEGKTHRVYQLLCDQREIKRSRYLQKRIPNPFLESTIIQTITKDDQYAMVLETNKRHMNDKRKMVSSELRHMARIRDKHQCVQCGSKWDLMVHHTKGIRKSHKLEDMVTLCRECHHGEHNFRK